MNRRRVDLLQKYFSDSVCVNSCPLFPVPCSLFPTSARSLVKKHKQMAFQFTIYDTFPIWALSLKV
ncbi:MAG: hypothetical protein F6K26_47675 [Moorea sp. SIO2I5]|nr:hypothetical protein [Moorena sp. SIO2I5]